jgi:hypothetical protein
MAQQMIWHRVKDSYDIGITVEIAGIHCLNREPAAEDA